MACWKDTGTKEGIKYTMVKWWVIKTHHSCVVIKTYNPHMWRRGIKYNGNFTSVIFPREQELSPICGQFIEHLGQGFRVITKLNLYLCFKKRLVSKCYGPKFFFFDNMFFFTLKHIHAPPPPNKKKTNVHPFMEYSI